MRVIICALALAASLLSAPGGLHADPSPGAPEISGELRKAFARAHAARAASDPVRTRHRKKDGSPRFTNRLILQKSPYLLQHSNNPVNWYPWGEEAFAAAKKLNRPVLLSIGYSTCHWCHVMEEESFEDLEIAEYLNRNYIAIKVDREERPDIDEVYMSAVRALTGGGGWPMTVWLTSDREPFYGGTYFPARDGGRGDRPGFLTLLTRLREIYDSDPARVAGAGRELRQSLEASLAPTSTFGALGPQMIETAVKQYRSQFDAQNGGLRGRTKFPSSLPIPILLRAHRRSGDAELLKMATRTLDAMRRGGLYDHIGGGFHRYSTEPSWTVPHFEKMLYDNALLVTAYVEAAQVTREGAYVGVARDVLEYVQREMTAPEGTFYSATDADSEGEEGTFFVWTADQIRAAVGPELAPLALDAYGIGGVPNFEGKYILRRDATPKKLEAKHSGNTASSLSVIRERLRETRSKRIPPLRDEKQIVAWNGLMISAHARAGAAMREQKFIDSAARAARTILKHGQTKGRLARYVRGGEAHGIGLLDDHSFLIAGLLDVFEANGEAEFLDAAIRVQGQQDERFFDENGGGYWMTPADGELLIARTKPSHDSARPSGNSIAALNLQRLHLMTSNAAYADRAEMTLRAFAPVLEAGPSSVGRMLDALDFLFDTPKEIMIVTPHKREEAEPFLEELRRVFLPNRILVFASEAEAKQLESRIPLLKEKRAIAGKTTAYVCENKVCELPTDDPKTFAQQITKSAKQQPSATP